MSAYDDDYDNRPVQEVEIRLPSALSTVWWLSKTFLIVVGGLALTSLIIVGLVVWLGH